MIKEGIWEGGKRSGKQADEWVKGRSGQIEEGKEWREARGQGGQGSEIPI